VRFFEFVFVSFLYYTILVRMVSFDHVVDLGLTLQAGQVFSWRFISDEWVGVIDATVFWLRQEETSGKLTFRYDGEIKSDKAALCALEKFFQVHIPLQAYLARWSADCHLFKTCIQGTKFATGLRVCQQDPFECLISFIVSANNHIKRISKNLVSIRTKYGKKVNTQCECDMYSFPTPVELGRATIDELRDLGLGYRAPYIVKTVGMLVEDDMYASLLALRGKSDIAEAREALLRFQGVGRKVADCVALYSLDHHALAPVDTHMLQIAQRIFKGTKINKDNNMHDRIQELMIQRYGQYAGIAHCYLFAADLPQERAKKPNSNKTE
jgi:N-glycosylase/DNA lyase